MVHFLEAWSASDMEVRHSYELACSLSLQTLCPHSVWIFPSLSIILALLTVVLLSRIDRALGWEMNISEDTARMVMGTVAASMFTLVVVGSSAILLVVQLASA